MQLLYLRKGNVYKRLRKKVIFSISLFRNKQSVHSEPIGNRFDGKTIRKKTDSMLTFPPFSS